MDYRETQKIDVTWLRWLFIITGVTIFVIMGVTMYYDPEEANNPGMYVGIGITFITMAATYALVFYSELQTSITTLGWHYKYAPFIYREKTIKWNDIASWEIVKVSDAIGFVGYGYKRQAFRKITAFLMGGKMVVRFVLTNGQTFIFNTGKPDEVKSALIKRLASKEKVK